jgi:hypothetical protein
MQQTINETYILNNVSISVRQLRGFSPLANYTDRAAAACRRC